MRRSEGTSTRRVEACPARQCGGRERHVLGRSSAWRCAGGTGRARMRRRAGLHARAPQEGAPRCTALPPLCPPPLRPPGRPGGCATPPGWAASPAAASPGKPPLPCQHSAAAGRTAGAPPAGRVAGSQPGGTARHVVLHARKGVGWVLGTQSLLRLHRMRRAACRLGPGLSTGGLWGRRRSVGAMLHAQLSSAAEQVPVPHPRERCDDSTVSIVAQREGTEGQLPNQPLCFGRQARLPLRQARLPRRAAAFFTAVVALRCCASPLRRCQGGSGA